LLWWWQHPPFFDGIELEGSTAPLTRADIEGTVDPSNSIPSKNGGCCHHHNNRRFLTSILTGKDARAFIYDSDRRQKFSQNALLSKRLDQPNKDARYIFLSTILVVRCSTLNLIST
jgi:hypothetical protein